MIHVHINEATSEFHYRKNKSFAINLNVHKEHIYNFPFLILHSLSSGLFNQLRYMSTNLFLPICWKLYLLFFSVGL